MSSPQFFSRSPEQFGGKIPFVVTDMIDQLRALDAANSEGIFRLSGSAKDISDLASAFDLGRISDWSKYKNITTIACTLKKYFRDKVTHDPILPFSRFNEIIEIPDKAKSDEEAAKSFRQILDGLSKVRFYTLAVLLKYLHEVSLSETSKMHANNLAIVFSPNLLQHKPGLLEPQETILYNKQQNKSIAMMIRLYDQIFQGVEIGDELLVKDEDIPILSLPPINETDVQNITEIRKLRMNSLIPFVPYDFVTDPEFVRPSRSVNVQSE